MDSQLGVHPEAWMPELAAAALPLGPERRAPSVVTNGERTPGKVAIFATCYVNYNEPGIGHDLVKLLDHNQHPLRDRREGTVLRHAQARAGRPEGVERAQGRQHPGAGATRARATPSSRRCRAAR
jgi:hypothetical protein